jgi:TPR repeat protein
VCGAPSSARCARCLGAFYCGGGCQRADWAAHKALCKEAGRIKELTGTAGSDESLDAWLAETKAKAEAGGAAAQFNLGLCYKNGTGVAADSRAAFEWFRRAATAGYAPAINAVGVCFKDGTGVAVDAKEAFTWYRRGAEAGDTEALVAYRSEAPNGARNHPTDEHLLPLFVAMGAAGAGAPGMRIHTSQQYGVLMMDCYRFG